MVCYSRFGEYLISEMGQDPAKLHLIGHSLGSHIVAYMAKGIPNIGHLTGMYVPSNTIY